jgi:hypothetical protein
VRASAARAVKARSEASSARSVVIVGVPSMGRKVAELNGTTPSMTIPSAPRRCDDGVRQGRCVIVNRLIARR